MIKRIVFALSTLFLLPALALAQGFSSDVSYGMCNSNVLEVQEFLGAHKYFAGPYSGCDYSLTTAAVKRFQAANGIPTTGYFGPLSRAKAQELVAIESPDNEEATTTPDVAGPTGSVQQTTWPQRITLPNGGVLLINEDGTFSVLPTTTTNPTNPTPTTMQDSPAGGAQVPQDGAASAPAPFVHSGTVTASLASETTEITLPAGRVVLATIAFTNNTNERLLFNGIGNENSFFVFSSNTSKDWTPSVTGVYRNSPLAGDQRGILPGETVGVQFILDSLPAGKVAFATKVKSFKLVGATSGDFIEVQGFPVDLGTIQIQ